MLSSIVRAALCVREGAVPSQSGRTAAVLAEAR
jgi:hypothetical protein